MKGRKNSDYFVFFYKNFGEYFVVANLVSNIPFQWKVSHPHGTSSVITTIVTRIRIIDTHKEMVVVYNLPKRSGQVYDDWTMM